ncbi:MAG: M50 family metallopeptidase [Persicimonas sp.]
MFGNSSKRWKLFTLFGHPIYVTPFFLVLIAFFAFSGLQAGAGMEALTNIIVWAPVLFIGILFHEFGHAFALQAYGYGNSRIVLHGFGGVTINERRKVSPPGKSIMISLAGPIASLLLAVISGGALLLYTGLSDVASAFEGGGVFATFLQTMALVNVVWAVFNMLPINPMDGGHVVLHGLRWGLKDQRKAMRYSAISSLVFLGLLVLGLLALGFGGLGLIWILVIAGMFAMQNWQILKSTNQQRPRGF